MIDTQTPGSPGWWFKRLADKQAERLPVLERYQRYGEGEHDLPEGHRRAREVFCQFQRRARSNFTGLVAESVIERARIIGFRAGGELTAEDDADAWAIWQANQMDADFSLLIRAACYMGESYILVQPPDGSAGRYPVMSAEDPREFVVEMDPVRKRRVIAALKIWADDIAGERRAVLFLPDSTHGFSAPLEEGAAPAWAGFDSAPWAHAGESPNPAGRVPVVRVPNRMDLFGNTRPEFADVMDIQDRINGQILNRLVIAAMSAHRQRWVKGVALEDEEGNPLDLVPGADLVWNIESDEAEFGEFSEANLQPILAAVKDDVRDLAAISRTPPHYLLAEFTNTGGDAFAQSETGHVAKVTERETHYGEAAEDAIRIAYLLMGDAERAAQFDSEVIWADPQYRSLAEKADAAVKLGAAGVPWRTLMLTVMGYTPRQVARMESERTSDVLTALLAQPAQPQTALPAGADGP